MNRDDVLRVLTNNTFIKIKLKKKNLNIPTKKKKKKKQLNYSSFFFILIKSFLKQLI